MSLYQSGFDTHASGYSPVNALFLGEAAQAAYGDAERMKQWAGEAGFDACSPFAGPAGNLVKGNIEGFVAASDDTLLVSFRGTDPTAGDWFLDFKTIPERDPALPGAVHHGFRTALNAVWAQVRPHLDARGHRRVWITGHSLGGALAVACATRALFEDPANPVGIRGIYTFGQPRFGNRTCSEETARHLASVLFRHVNDRDIVPRVPPFALGFRHWGTEILFNENGPAHVNSDPVESHHNILWRLRENPPDLEFEQLRHLHKESFEVATDHFMEKAYLPLLRRAAGRS